MAPEGSASRRLYRSRSERMIAGVCGGLASFFGTDPNLVRLLFVLSIFLGGAGLVIYIAAIFIVPPEPVGTPPPSGESS